MKKDIVYHIESQFIDDHKKTITLIGWGYHCVNKKALDISVKMRPQISTFEIQKIDKVITGATTSLSDSEKYGFVIVIAMKNMKDVVRVVFSSGGDSRRYCLKLGFSIQRVGIKINRGIKFLEKNGLKSTFKKMKRHFFNTEMSGYDFGVYQKETYEDKDILAEIDTFVLKPKISIVVPVYNVGEEWLKKSIDSVRSQFYENWELCLADDHSSMPHVRSVLEEYRQLDDRIKVVFREKNGHISEATNSAIAIATGDYIGFMDNDDELTPITLFRYIKAINENPVTDFLYCDEDMTDTNGRYFNPFFKQSWNAEMLLTHNYITHFVVVKRELLKEVGPLRTEFNGSQDYDFCLRATEKAKAICHIPEVLYHWRAVEGSVADDPSAKTYAYEAGKKALDEALERRSINATAEIGKYYGTYDINYNYAVDPAVTVVIQKENIEDGKLDNLIDSIIKKSHYLNYNILVICDVEKQIVIEGIDIRYIKDSVNVLEKKATGDYLVFISSDYIIETENWISKFLNYIQLENVGLASAKVLDASKCVYDAGVWYDDENALLHHVHYGCFKEDLGYYYRLAVPQYIFASAGECIILSKKDFIQVGGFDQNLKNPLKEVDLCLKIRETGQQILFVPNVQVAIQESNQTSRISIVGDECVEPEAGRQFSQKWGNKLCDPYTNPNVIQNKM